MSNDINNVMSNDINNDINNVEAIDGIKAI